MQKALQIHLGRSDICRPAVKPPLPPSASTNCEPDIDISVPQAVKEAIKSPSTTVENSKHGCKMCHVLSTKDHFISTSTHRIYKCEIPSNISKIDCNTCNVIYLITCKKCALQYVIDLPETT